MTTVQGDVYVILFMLIKCTNAQNMSDKNEPLVNIASVFASVSQSELFHSGALTK